MLLAEETLSIGWLLGLLAGSGGVIAFLFWQLIGSKDRELASQKAQFVLLLAEKDRDKLECEGMWKSYKEIAAEAVKSTAEVTNYYRAKYEMKPPIAFVAPVVTESHSTPTALQRETASIATLRSRMEHIVRETGQTVRVESPAVASENG